MITLNHSPSKFRLYWIGLFEEGRRGWIWRLIFQVDLAPIIGRSAKRFVGGGEHACVLLLVLTWTKKCTAVSVLSVLCNALVILPIIIVCLLSVISLHLPRQGEFDPIERTVGGFILLLILLVFYS